MSKKDTKSFKVPKIKRVESKDNLRQVDISSRDCLELVNAVKRSYLASDYESPWKLKTAALVENRELEAVYRAKKADLKEEGRHARDLTDHFAFIIQRDSTIVSNVVRDGLKCKYVHQNSLGDSKLGVYVCRNADVQLRYADGWKLPTCTLLMFKIVLGKCKSLAQQASEDKIEPTPNYDCHIPQVPARPSDNFSVQLARSQVYLYEYTDDCEPSVRPRQVLPYAVLTYEKAEKVPSSSLSSKVDSYSKRPTYTHRLVESDTSKSASAQLSMNKRDPRISKAKLKPDDNDGGLCVPRLTSGPPTKESYTSNASSIGDNDDPRSQLSFLTLPSKPSFDLYQPSFGPGFEEQKQSSQDEGIEPEEPLTSLPPLKLPRMPSPNSQLDTRYTDPRFGYVDANVDVLPNDSGFVPNDTRLRTNAPSFLPNDPRLRPNDPRLQSLQTDPRSLQLPLDPRRQQRPLDPRLQQQLSDPRMLAADPRLQHNVNSNIYLQQASKPNNEDATKTRKKLSLSDYKKKVNISKTVVTKEFASSSNETEYLKDENYISTVTTTLSITQTALTETDPTLEDQDYRPILNKLSSHPIAYENESRFKDEDFVEEPDDMAKTLNELSDPDDISQSPKEADKDGDESVAKQPATDDPMLSEAMQKLVEHSGNVTLFTEALRLLQESAEEFGDQLTDPEFLVKKIAEKIDELSKLEAQKEDEATQQIVTDIVDVKEIDSPEMIKSPDISSDSKTEEITPVKHIPLENVDIDAGKSLECVDMEISDPESEDEPESKLDLAMQKTLEELARLEQSQSSNVLLKNSNKVNPTEQTVPSHKESSPALDLSEIPIPKGPPAQLRQEVPGKLLQTNSELRSTKMVTQKKVESDDEEDEMKVSQILPSLKDKKKATISINLQMNQKSKTKATNNTPETVPDIFKDDIDLRVLTKKNNKDLGFEQVDKDFRTFSVQQTQSLKTNKDNIQKSDKNQKGIVVFDSGKIDIDHRKNSKLEKLNKMSDIVSSVPKISEKLLENPFGLGNDDIDHRKINDPDPIQKSEINAFGDIDWRTASDVDLRSADTSTENSQSSNIGDFDLRQSHSRSVSPPSRIPTSDKEKAKFSKPPVRKFVDPFGLDEDIDERVVSRSNSPVVSESGKHLKAKGMAIESVNDSNSSSGILFDAYSIGQSKSEVSNEFGDVDWRQAAAAEMGDVDLRLVPGEKPNQISNVDQRPVISTAAPIIIPKHTDHSKDPFQQMNKNLQNMFNISQSLPAYHATISLYDSYSTDKSSNTRSYDQYTTSENEVIDELRTSQVSNEFLPSYTTSASQQKHANQGGIHNIMQNLDFSNLKNILATVKQPGSSTEVGGSTVNEDEEEIVKTAFVTGLSPTARKYGSSVEETSSPMKQRDEEDTSEGNKSVKTANDIPGLDISPEKISPDQVQQTTPSKEKTDSLSTEKSKQLDTMSMNIKEKDSLPSTPKKQSKRNDNEDVMTPMPNISYQAAILESMEQSALKVRNDDSFTSEMEDSPLRSSKKQRRKHSKHSDKDNESDKKRRKVSNKDILGKEELEKDKEPNERFEDADDDTDDDEEESGLVIDLDFSSPVVKQASEKESKANKDILKEDFIDLTDAKESDLEVEPILVIADDEAEENKSEDLQAENTLYTKTKDEMTNMIEKSRKNMVIKLKGETKLVNPKTGKAYNESVKGSAIEVLGKSSTAKDSPIQHIHPIHGIVPINHGNPKTAQSSSKPQADLTKGQNISAIGNSDSNLPSTNKVSTATGISVYGQTSQRQQNQSPILGISASQFGNQAPRPHLSTVGSTVNEVQTNPLEYIHPITGRTVLYGRSDQTQPGIVSTIPLGVSSTQPVPLPQSGPPLTVQPHVPGQILVLPGQRPPASGQITGSLGVSRLPFLPMTLNQQGPGIPTAPGNLVRQPNSSPVEAKTSTDVFDCFRDKYEKRNVKNETKPNQNYAYETSSESKMAYSVKMFLEDIENKAKKELNAQAKNRSIDTVVKSEPIVKKTVDISKIESTDTKSKKRSGDEESITVPVKKTKSESDLKTKSQNDFGSRILESLTEVKNKLRSPEKVAQSPEKPKIIPKLEIKTEVKVQKVEVKKEMTESGASSELEDGEISEDSNSESEEIKPQVQDMSIAVGASIPVLGSKPSQFNRIPTVGAWQQGPSNMGITKGNNSPPRQITTIGSNKPNVSAFTVGADWADVIQNPETRTMERVKATKIESPSLCNNPQEFKDDTASLVSKSAASISKSRQKNKAQSQVKTLGEWLKLELEIDNIEPLKRIIPYDLDTDLTKIPKQRKRRIRMKVKNAIEQEGSKANSFERQDTVTVEVLLNDPPAPKPAVKPATSSLNYAPEVSNEQTEREMKMLGSSLNLLREKVNHQTAVSGLSVVQSGQFFPRSITASLEDKKMIVAMTLVESEMRTHLGRTCFYGYPHRRVPDELLLNSEIGGFKSEVEDVFLILMMPLSAKPYNKLLHLKYTLCELYEKRKSTQNPNDISKLDEEIRQLHNQRQAVLRGFTGYLNKKRIQKLQETVDKYTLVYDYFRSKTPATPDSMLRFIRTTQMDLRQHLILARQYLALEAQKMQ